MPSDETESRLIRTIFHRPFVYSDHGHRTRSVEHDAVHIPRFLHWLRAAKPTFEQKTGIK
jgi:hypothetical protein